MREFVRQCLHCADTRSGDVVSRPLGETVHGTAPNEVVHFDYLHAGESGSDECCVNSPHTTLSEN